MIKYSIEWKEKRIDWTWKSSSEISELSNIERNKKEYWKSKTNKKYINIDLIRVIQEVCEEPNIYVN